MTDSIFVIMRFGAYVRFAGDACWESWCPSLDIFSQGDSEEEAKSNIKEAVELWFESCLERNTLSDALLELGWTPAPAGLPTPSETDSIEVVSPKHSETSTRHGDLFPLEVTIPAYQAAMFSGEPSEATC